jgi:hypothetical protein
MGWEGFNWRGGGLLLQEGQFLYNHLIREYFSFENKLTGLFQLRMTIFLGQTEDAQARSIGLLRKRSRLEGAELACKPCCSQML